jgi:exodeoxyribonuclease VII large subunit
MSNDQDESARSIQEIGSLIKSLVEPETMGYQFWTRGFVQNFRPSDRGHLYFELRDNAYQIRCIVREDVRRALNPTLANDTEVEIFGSVGVYEHQARAQIEVANIRLIERQPFILDDSTRRELENKGLWPKTKRPLPSIIRRIGLITSQYSEAYYDFRSNFEKEGGLADIDLSSVPLQGPDAPTEITSAIQKYNNLRDVDVIVLMRGGGSQADLALFNAIRIAEAISRSTIPLLTGIGHQRDETLADQVADLQESTATAVAFRLARHSQPEGTVPSKPSSVTIYLIGVIVVLVIVGLLMLFIARQ